jgi:hypothetical protein
LSIQVKLKKLASKGLENPVGPDQENRYGFIVFLGEIFRFTTDKTTVGCHAHVGLRGHDASRTCLSETSMAPVLKTENFNREEYKRKLTEQKNRPTETKE